MIVLARIEETGLQPTGKYVKRGVNYFPEMESCSEPHALMYANKELPGDLRRAQKLAAEEGYEVIVYPKGTRRPLDKAKAYLAQKAGLSGLGLCGKRK